MSVLVHPRSLTFYTILEGKCKKIPTKMEDQYVEVT